MRYRILPACLFVLMATAAWAQAPVGTISGTVRDQSDAVVPGATITIRNTATGVERHLVSDTDGTFSAPSLAAGAYAVTGRAERLPHAAHRSHRRHRPRADAST